MGICHTMSSSRTRETTFDFSLYLELDLEIGWLLLEAPTQLWRVEGCQSGALLSVAVLTSSWFGTRSGSLRE